MDAGVKCLEITLVFLFTAYMSAGVALLTDLSLYINHAGNKHLISHDRRLLFYYVYWNWKVSVCNGTHKNRSTKCLFSVGGWINCFHRST